jgi:hypothetical protein
VFGFDLNRLFLVILIIEIVWMLELVGDLIVSWGMEIYLEVSCF